MRIALQRVFCTTLTMLIVLSSAIYAQSTITINVNSTDDKAGGSAVYDFSFTTSQNGNNTVKGIPANGKIEFVFPTEFDLSGVDIVDSKTDTLTGGFFSPVINGNTVEVTRDGTGNDVDSLKDVLVSLAIIGNPDSAAFYQITLVTKTAAGDTIDFGDSNNFEINHGPLDHFQLNTTGDATAGSNYALEILAKDRFDNIITSFSGDVDILDRTGTMNTDQAKNFISGIWQDSVKFTKAYNINRITANYNGKGGKSGDFNVVHGNLDHFSFDNIPSPKIAGVSFNIRIVAYDEYDNVVTGFNSRVNLTDLTNSLNISESDNFNSGILNNQSVTITKSRNNNIITAICPAENKSGESNYFNVEAGEVTKFYISPISSPQLAGDWFNLTIIAQDNWNNTVTDFTGKVLISDLSGTISPSQSESFGSGQWTGNVKVASIYDNDVITVENFAGTGETGSSNQFNIVTSGLDHFDINTIATPQTAGNPFSITIEAKDAQGNTVTSFTGQVNLNDMTETISPTSSGNFSNGTWSGLITITRAKENNRIYVSGSNKNGTSNNFSVIAGALDHFYVESISSPQVAGQNFNLSIEARDSNENLVTDFNDQAKLDDNTHTISPAMTTNFSSGSWSGNVLITKASTNNRIRIENLSADKEGFSNYFSVNPDMVRYVIILDNPGGLGSEVADSSFNLYEQIKLHAAGYDQWNNYVRDVKADWDTIGTLDMPTPVVGKSTIFKAVTPNTSGNITADSSGIIADSTGTFTVGTIDHVVIRTESRGQGRPVGDVHLTTDDTLKLYAAAYDASNNYIGPAVVNWSNDGSLSPVVSATDTLYYFAPTTARVSGHIIVSHASAPVTNTGLINVDPGAPVGFITLHPNPKIIPADTNAFSVITSDVIFDQHSNIIAEEELFTVRTSLGNINTPDADSLITGHQVASGADGRISFQVKAGRIGGTAYISMNSTGKGNAIGDTVLFITSLKIVSVNSEIKQATQGQADIPVRMIISNLGVDNIDILDADLKFIGPAPTYTNLSGQYNITRTDSVQQISPNTQKTLSFLVDVGTGASNVLTTVDGYISGEINGITVSDTAAAEVDNILIQKPPLIKIEKVEAFADTVIQSTNTTVTTTIRNDGEATAVIDSDSLLFWAETIGQNVTDEYLQTAFFSNPDSIAGYSTEIFRYSVRVGANASLDTVTLNAKVETRDVNTGASINDFNADEADGWWVKQASDVEISEFSASQSTVTNGQDEDWFLNMMIANSGGASLKLDSTRILFSVGANDISDEYRLIKPTTFQMSSDDTLRAGQTDTLTITVDETGSTLGTVTITGTVYLRDQVSGQIIKNSVTGVTVQAPAQLTLNNIRKSKNEVTVGQMHPWNIVLSLKNNGGGDIAIDSTRLNDFIQFDDTTYSFVEPSEFAGSQNFILKSGREDSLIYIINKTGNLSGQQKILVDISAEEINSSRMLNAVDSTTIKVETPAQIRLKNVRCRAPNAPNVNTNQNYIIEVTAENIGEDTAEDVYISLASDSASLISNPIQMIETIKGGSISDTLLFNIQAHSEGIADEIFTAQIDSAQAENTPEEDKLIIAQALDSTAISTVQLPANLEVLAIETSTDTVNALSRERWDVMIAIKNIGEETVLFDKPDVDNISFWNDGELQDDYSISAPPGFKNSPDLFLSGDEIDTLIYEMNRTGLKGSHVKIKAALTGLQYNVKQQITVRDSVEIFVRPSANVFINVTEPVCPNVNQFGVGQVNNGQGFKVRARIKNAGAERVDDVVVTLYEQAGTYSIPSKSIDFIEPSGDASVEFNVTALELTEQIDFIAKIESAIAHESQIQAYISEASDSVASFRIHSPAQLRMNVLPSDTVLTANQIGYFNLQVINEGTAEVKNMGRLSLETPHGYYVKKGEQLVRSDTASFTINETISWDVAPPDYSTENDTFVVFLFSPPLDKNSETFAIVQNPYKYLVVKTVPSDISTELFEISSPVGAKDDTLSTEQHFTVKLEVRSSENLDSLRATLHIPQKFGFAIDEDSTKSLNMILGEATWRLKASETSTIEPAWIKVSVSGRTDGNTVTYQDSFSVVVQRRAILVLDQAWVSWPSSTEQTLSAGQEFDLSVVVNSKNSNQAEVYGPANLRIHFGSTGVSTTESLIKPFLVDSTVTWRLEAPSIITGKNPITIFLETIPFDENTGLPADVWSGQSRIDFYVETVKPISVEIDNFRISSPVGATDRILSTYQKFQVESIIRWENSADVPNVTLNLPNGFTTPESNPKKPADVGQEGTVSWQIQAPETEITDDQYIWLQLSAQDKNMGQVFSFTSDSISVNAVKRAEISLNAQITAPQSALDLIVSVGEEFVLNAFLTNEGNAGMTGSYSVNLTLPEGLGYSTNQNLTITKPYNESAEWTIRAPYSKREAANIEVTLVSFPQDENSNADIEADAISLKNVAIPISTEEKSVTITPIPNIGRNSIARGETSVTMFALDFSVSGDAFSNNILFSGVKIKLKDRFGNNVDNPSSFITKLSVTNRQDKDIIYGIVNDIPVSNPIEVIFSKIDTLKPDVQNRVDFDVDISHQANLADFKLVIDSSSAFYLLDEGSQRIPIVKDSNGDAIETLNLGSPPSIIIDSDFRKSFSNYPNPFGEALKPTTSFVYYLENESDVQIRIYTLVGELVWSRSYTKNEAQGRQGTHNGDIIWDATNDKGYEVLNGVYIAQISLGGKKQAITKIAVVK